MKFYAMAKDPIHIGKGGNSWGIIDNEIVRDPTTDIPIIPGTSLAGSIKQQIEGINKEEFFGTNKQKGKLRFYDAKILLFPIYSLDTGLVMITREKKFSNFILDEKNGESRIILNWLVFPTKNNDLQITNNEQENGENESDKNVIEKITKNIGIKNIYYVKDDLLFSRLINENLDVRTSVKINPETGVAEEGALFTYELIPRSTIFEFEIDGASINGHINDKIIRVGGMTTRGFGRIEIKKGDENAKDRS